MPCLSLIDMTGLYIHIPFCEKKCSYCDFVSFGGRQTCLPSYLDALKNEALRYRGKSIDTVFIGGGTPSLMTQWQTADLMTFLRQNFSIASDAEITIECNPASLTYSKLLEYRAVGINRISVGAQSLSDEVLSDIGRCHTAAQLEEAVNSVKRAGFENFNLDLIFALPGQTLEAWKKTLLQALSYNPAHISCYSLTIEPDTPLGRDVLSGRLRLPEEETERAMYSAVGEILAQCGIFQYEISNYAKPGRECRHNLNYWLCGEYIGLGCAAHSYYEGNRYRNTQNLEKYIMQKDIMRDIHPLTEEDRMNERIMLGLRLNRGMDIVAFNKDFGVDFFKKYGKAIKKNQELDLIAANERFIRLTERGRDFADTVTLDFI